MVKEKKEKARLLKDLVTDLNNCGDFATDYLDVLLEDVESPNEWYPEGVRYTFESRGVVRLGGVERIYRVSLVSWTKLVEFLYY